MAVVQAKMPKRTFIESYSGNEANPKWLTPVLKGKQKWVAALKQHDKEIKAVQAKLALLEKQNRITISRAEGHQPRNVHR